MTYFTLATSSYAIGVRPEKEPSELVGRSRMDWFTTPAVTMLRDD